jgi:hypothetical protein
MSFKRFLAGISSINAALAMFLPGSIQGEEAERQLADAWRGYSGSAKRDYARGANTSIAGNLHLNLESNARRRRQIAAGTLRVSA